MFNIVLEFKSLLVRKGTLTIATFPAMAAN